jgi:hypothetical protein
MSKRAGEVTLAQGIENAFTEAKRLKALLNSRSASEKGRSYNPKAIGLVASAITIMVGVQAQLVKGYEEKGDDTTRDSEVNDAWY